MFDKDWRQRLTDTITFIRTAPVPANAAIRELIADVLQSKYLPNILQATSTAMSQGSFYDLKDRDTKKQYRKYRRALILIRSVILGTPAGMAATAVALIPDGMLAGILGNDLGSAQQHELALLQAKLTALTTNPAAFLGANKILMEATPGHSGSMQYLFYYDPVQERYDFRRTANLRGGEVRVGGVAGMGAADCRLPHLTPWVHHVHVQSYETLHATATIGAIVGAALSNADTIMITTQLSGCSLVYQTAGTDLTASHVLPMRGDAAGGGYALVTTLRAHSAFANPPAGGGVRYVFGAQPVQATNRDYVPKGPSNPTYVIGIKRNGAWEIHAQQYPTAKGSVPTTWQVEP